MEKLPELFAAEENSVIRSLEEKWLKQKYCQGQPLGFKFADYDRHNIKLPCEIYDEDEFSEMLESLKSRSWKSSAEEMRNWYRLSCGIATTGINFEKILERLDTTGDEDAKLNDVIEMREDINNREISFDTITSTDLMEKVTSKLNQYRKFLDLSSCEDLADVDFAMEDVEEQIQIECPISKKRIRRAAKGPNCNHRFDFDAFTATYAQKRDRDLIRCPLPGCPAEKFQKKQVQLDPEYQTKIDQRRG